MTICALLKPVERRECVRCHEARPAFKFRKNRRVCNACEAAYMKTWHAKQRAAEGRS
jgi:uncharacterized protein (DUF983 family)